MRLDLTNIHLNLYRLLPVIADAMASRKCDR